MTNSEIDSEIQELQDRIGKIRKLRLLREQAETLETGRLPETDIPETINDITNLICNHFKISPRSIFSRERTEKISIPRQIIFYIGRSLNFTHDSIAECFKRDHGTVIHGCKTIEDKMATEPAFKDLVEHLKNSFDVMNAKNT